MTRIEGRPNPGPAMRFSASGRSVQRFVCRHSQPPLEFRCGAHRLSRNSPKKPGIWRMSDADNIIGGPFPGFQSWTAADKKRLMRHQTLRHAAVALAFFAFVSVAI